MSLLFATAAAPAAGGMSTDGLQAVAALFDAHLAGGLHPGAHLLVIRRRQIVCDRYAGLADPRRRRPVQPDTIWLLFSATKPYTAVAVLKLAAEGKIDLDAPVARYWPAFAQNGKAEITVRQVLSHRAGLPHGRISRQPWYWPSWRLCIRAIEQMKPDYPPGQEVAYHALTFGWILGELLRRVDGRSLRRFLADELFGPAGWRHTYLGLPGGGGVWERRNSVAAIDQEPDLRQSAFVANHRLFRRAPIPAGSGHSTLYEHAAFYQMLLDGGVWNGRRLLSPAVVELLTTPTNPDPGQMDLVLGKPTRWGHGVSLGGPPRQGLASFMGRASSPRAFGHGGLRSLAAWADPDRQLICLYFTNGLLSAQGSDERNIEMSDAVLASVV